jgi:hypothetical protein
MLNPPSIFINQLMNQSTVCNSMPILH